MSTEKKSSQEQKSGTEIALESCKEYQELRAACGPEQHPILVQIMRAGLETGVQRLQGTLEENSETMEAAVHLRAFLVSFKTANPQYEHYINTRTIQGLISFMENVDSMRDLLDNFEAHQNFWKVGGASHIADFVCEGDREGLIAYMVKNRLIGTAHPADTRQSLLHRVAQGARDLIGGGGKA